MSSRPIQQNNSITSFLQEIGFRQPLFRRGSSEFKYRKSIKIHSAYYNNIFFNNQARGRKYGSTEKKFLKKTLEKSYYQHQPNTVALVFCGFCDHICFQTLEHYLKET